MHYSTVKLADRKFSVYEIPSKEIVITYRTLKKAKEITNKLNNGCGFNGWTPTFLCK